MVLQNGHKLISIHIPRNPCKLANTIPSHTPPYHNVSPSKLDCPLTSLSINPSPFCFQTHCLPSDPNLVILVSSEKMTLFQSSTVHSLCFKAKANLSYLCLALRKGFFFFTTALNECFLRTLLTVSEETGWGIIVLMCLVT